MCTKLTSGGWMDLVMNLMVTCTRGTCVCVSWRGFVSCYERWSHKICLYSLCPSLLVVSYCQLANYLHISTKGCRLFCSIAAETWLLKRTSVLCLVETSGANSSRLSGVTWTFWICIWQPSRWLIRRHTTKLMWRVQHTHFTTHNDKNWEQDEKTWHFHFEFDGQLINFYINPRVCVCVCSLTRNAYISL